MTPIEIMAFVLAVIVLGKILVLAFNPTYLKRASRGMFKNSVIIMGFILVIVVMSGYYLLQSLDIVTIAAVMFFTAMLYSLAILPYSKDVSKLADSFLKKDVLKRSWLSFLIWMGISLWVLYNIFM